ncbi:MAG TPA: DNA gyrase C-terminal beta-propeller domain-containing protein, partial [Legionellaceae bacterium]|nr:DNA gyrase C-terminal beta-propeller domain-containing protein [Legionellaceae bacterium]
LIRSRDELQAILAQDKRLRALVKKEINEDRKRYGDPRSSPLIERQEACALKEEDILPNEPMTVILSQQGWVRAAKGFDIDGKALVYKAGDEFLVQTNTRSNQQVLFWDTEGKVYAILGHALPSARGQGEPLTGKLNPAEGASFAAVISGEPEDRIIVVSDAGYGFRTQLQALYVKNRNGKACLKLPEGSRVLSPRLISNEATDQAVCVTNTGRLLLFPIAELPELSRGKGNKLIQIPSAKVKTREEYLLDVQILRPDQQTITIYAGKRSFTLKHTDLVHYQGARGTKGHRLPRGLQAVTGMAIE